MTQTDQSLMLLIKTSKKVRNSEKDSSKFDMITRKTFQLKCDKWFPFGTVYQICFSSERRKHLMEQYLLSIFLFKF